VLTAYRSVAAHHRTVRALDDNGEFLCSAPDADCAVNHVTRAEAAASHRLDAALESAIVDARQRMSSDAHDARAGFDSLAFAIPILVVITAALVLIGFGQRVKEYR